MTSDPTFPAPHTMMWPRRWIRRKPCTKRVCAELSADVIVAVITAKMAIPTSIVSMATSNGHSARKSPTDAQLLQGVISP